jgi:hypothetical protein
MMEKLDLKKTLKHLYNPTAKTVVEVDVPEMRFLMLNGEIEPAKAPDSSPAFQAAFEVMFGLGYGLKFRSKLNKQRPVDYTVMPLEGLWWTEDGVFDLTNPSGWLWTLMMMIPDHITPADFDAARRELAAKKNPANLPGVRFERWREGLSLQIMHIGPYADEPRSLQKLEAYASQHGYHFKGKHHEIYLGDPRRSAPDKLKTVLRHPVSE